MKTILRALSSALFLSLVACGTDTSALNTAEISDSESESQMTTSEEETLGLDMDACALKANQLTFTLATGGSLELSYKFFSLSKGDRIKIKNAESGAVVYDSLQLSQAEGVVSLPVAQLGAGRFIAEGYMNTLAAKQDSAVDCKLPSRIVIRKK